MRSLPEETTRTEQTIRSIKEIIHKTPKGSTWTESAARKFVEIAYLLSEEEDAEKNML